MFICINWTEFISNTITRLFFFAFPKNGAGAALKSRLRLSAPTDQKIESGTGSGAALKMAAPDGSGSNSGSATLHKRQWNDIIIIIIIIIKILFLLSDLGEI